MTYASGPTRRASISGQLPEKIRTLSRRGTQAARTRAERATRSSDSGLPGQYFSTRPRFTKFSIPSTTIAAMSTSSRYPRTGMKSGIRSTGETRYRTAAASAIFAALGRTGSTARPVMVRTMDGRARSSALMSFQDLGDQLAHVLHGERLLGALHLATEVVHGQTVGTARAHHVHLGLERILDEAQINAL